MIPVVVHSVFTMLLTGTQTRVGSYERHAESPLGRGVRLLCIPVVAGDRLVFTADDGGMLTSDQVVVKNLATGRLASWAMSVVGESSGRTFYPKGQLLRMNEIMRGYQRTWGERVLWFEYDAQSANKHQVYDEGPSRAWYYPVVLPVLFLDFRQDDPVSAEQGFYVLSTASIVFQVTEAMDRFRVNPLLTATHFRDRFQYDGNTYRVSKYEKQGFVNGTYLTVSVLGEQVRQEEVVNDIQQGDSFTQTLVW
jgi:hypothetical protein